MDKRDVPKREYRIMDKEGKEFVNVAMLHPIRSVYFEYDKNTFNTSSPKDLKKLFLDIDVAVRFLHDNGYYNEFIMGSDASFGYRDLLLEGESYDKILDFLLFLWYNRGNEVKL